MSISIRSFTVLPKPLLAPVKMEAKLRNAKFRRIVVAFTDELCAKAGLSVGSVTEKIRLCNGQSHRVALFLYIDNGRVELQSTANYNFPFNFAVSLGDPQCIKKCLVAIEQFRKLKPPFNPKNYFKYKSTY